MSDGITPVADAMFWGLIGVLATVFVMGLLPEIPMALYDLQPAPGPDGMVPL